jgi:hypothetical protein
MIRLRRFDAASIAALGAIALAACSHKVVVEDETEPAVVETERVVETDPAAVEVRLADEHVRLVREYYVERGCPDGFVQQGDVCVAEGVTTVETKRYVIGQPLPPDIVAVDLPPELVARLPALPDDYVYRIVDGDLAIVRRSTLVVLDASELY